jgi:hypothetical protein
MNYPAASYGVSKTPRNEASFGEYDPKRKIQIGHHQKVNNQFEPFLEGRCHVEIIETLFL